MTPMTGTYLPVSAPYQGGRTTSMIKRLTDLVNTRGIERGELAISLARQVDPHARIGDVMMIAGAEFKVTAR